MSKTRGMWWLTLGGDAIRADRTFVRWRSLWQQIQDDTWSCCRCSSGHLTLRRDATLLPVAKRMPIMIKSSRQPRHHYHEASLCGGIDDILLHTATRFDPTFVLILTPFRLVPANFRSTLVPDDGWLTGYGCESWTTVEENADLCF